MSSLAQTSDPIAVGNTGEHWAEVARLWQQLGPPLRPSAADVSIYDQRCFGVARRIDSLQALILGVTPELHALRWPSETDLLAIDHTRGMIEAVWPGPEGSALCAEWTDMPLESASRDVALCDGGLPLLAYPQTHRQLARELQRVLVRDGLFVTRLFVPSARHESVDEVLRDLVSGRVSCLNALKLRLWDAIQSEVSVGVRLGDVWNAVSDLAPSLDALADRLGWEREHLQPLTTYRECASRYHLVSVEEVTRVFCDECRGFDLRAVDIPSYPLGDRCPIVTFQRV